MNKRVFFAFKVKAPWPKSFPSGRLLAENDRHLTIAFLGNIDDTNLIHSISSFPKPPFRVGLTGWFDKLKFLPPRRANVACWHARFFDNSYDLAGYQIEIAEWLKMHQYKFKVHKGPFLPHVTLCRRPFSFTEWRNAFKPLTDLNLYESIGGLNYKPIWKLPIIPPFERNSKEASYVIYGESHKQLYANAYAAKAFESKNHLGAKPYANFEEEKESIIFLEKIYGNQWNLKDKPTYSEGIFRWKITQEDF